MKFQYKKKQFRVSNESEIALQFEPHFHRNDAQCSCANGIEMYVSEKCYSHDVGF